MYLFNRMCGFYSDQATSSAVLQTMLCDTHILLVMSKQQMKSEMCWHTELHFVKKIYYILRNTGFGMCNSVSWLIFFFIHYDPLILYQIIETLLVPK